jgi:uncharacterized protein DUF6941
VFRADQSPAKLQFYIVARVRYEPSEAGIHPIKISIVNQDGNYVIPPAMRENTIQFSEAGCVDEILLNIKEITFESFGEYSVVLQVDGEPLASQPLYVLPA